MYSITLRAGPLFSPDALSFVYVAVLNGSHSALSDKKRDSSRVKNDVSTDPKKITIPRSFFMRVRKHSNLRSNAE